MGSAVKKCRICGRNYEACRSANRSAGVFRWQEVSCSPKCGTEYLRQIDESRAPVAPVRNDVTEQSVIALNDRLFDDDDEAEADEEQDDALGGTDSEDKDLQ